MSSTFFDERRRISAMSASRSVMPVETSTRTGLHRPRRWPAANLTADFVLEDVFGVDRVAARVDDREFLAVPVGLAVVAVARGAGRRVHDGFALADQPVEEGRSCPRSGVRRLLRGSCSFLLIRTKIVQFSGFSGRSAVLVPQAVRDAYSKAPVYMYRLSVSPACTG